MPLEADHVLPGSEADPVVGSTLEDEELVLAVSQNDAHVV
jgi:hypothetical protein